MAFSYLNAVRETTSRLKPQANFPKMERQHQAAEQEPTRRETITKDSYSKKSSNYSTEKSDEDYSDFVAKHTHRN